jgi:hypothetical protein
LLPGGNPGNGFSALITPDFIRATKLEERHGATQSMTARAIQTLDRACPNL